MDIYKFINSKDIAEHLKSLNYEFTLPEAAFLVYQSHYRTMKEKCEAWQELIDTMPDCSMEERFNMARIESFHQFLRDYMALQDKMFHLFYDADGAVYTYELVLTGQKRTLSGRGLNGPYLYREEAGEDFANAGSAMAHFETNKEGYLEDGLQRLRFIKQPLLNESGWEKNYEIWVEMNPEMEVIRIDYTGTGILNVEDDTLFRQFDGMCFAFQTPFKRGDILIDRVHGGFAGQGAPFVLDSISTWSREDLLNNGYTLQHPRVKSADKDLAYKLKHGDYTDMNYAYCYLSSDSTGFPVISGDNEWTYLNLERYEGPLQGMYRVLRPLSSAMTVDPKNGNTLIGPDLFCNAYQLIMTEEMCRSNRAWIENYYTEEGQAKAGLKYEVPVAVNNNGKGKNICKKTRKDESPQKRVELHCHTNMSEMDGVSDVRDIINRAISWGHKAVAITDNGVVQAFPDAYQAVPKDSDFKVIYGMEAYLVDDFGESPEKEQVKKLRPFHAVILVANETGRVNLYRLVSYSHLEYFNRVPLIPKSLFIKNRRGLILGSAGEAGELYQALLHGASEEELARIIHFYNYLEIQPVGDKNLNLKIVELGDQYDKVVVATGDVHFLDPEDEVYRNILLANRDDQNDEHEAPLYFRTTEEMLDEFAYLGEKKAYQVVVYNTNFIAGWIERVVPIRTDKSYPVIANADQTLTEVCCERAHQIYGDALTKIVRERLEKELRPIIKNGFSSLYMIARKLVLKSNEDGYLVGSRGCAGASFVAYLAGITEVNPLPVHYVCPNCHYSDFDSSEVRQYAGMAGCDLPDKICPKCGTKMNKDGFDIPFETFLGLNGEKEPDFDLNFSGMYQYRALQYAEKIFGKDHTFRAGTVGTVQERTAREYVKHYLENHGATKKDCEINRLAEGCVGVKYTTGQHPGGIIALPIGEEICSFTPVQHPANDPDTDIITTHFDYHSIDNNLLKLDILGHDDPTMLHMLQKRTGVDPTTIPLDDPKILSLFTGTEALGITSDDIGDIPLGTLGIPEFGTEYSMALLMETQPTTFSELVRCVGLLHGTDVWQGNAQTLIRKGTATISNVISTRDDIMTYLISCGIDRELSFKIMESVRKGKGLRPEWEEKMTAHGVPDWYIWSCKQIRYMFPRSHAAAYLISSWRIAYYKVYWPLAFYATYFSIRGSGFDYEMMCMGKEHLLENMNDYERRKDSLSHREKDAYNVMLVVREMYARGLNFVPIDLYRADPHNFLHNPTKNLLMPSLESIRGISEDEAEAIAAACKDGPFLSIEDFMKRTKTDRKVSDLLVNLGILSELPEYNYPDTLFFS